MPTTQHESVSCDACGCIGQRPLTHVAPVNWFFLATRDDASGGSFVVFACSEACTRSRWERGPGPLVSGFHDAVTRHVNDRLATPAAQPARAGATQPVSVGRIVRVHGPGCPSDGFPAIVTAVIGDANDCVSVVVFTAASGRVGFVDHIALDDLRVGVVPHVNGLESPMSPSFCYWDWPPR